ncbi:MAG: xanthine dehydrogenase FAD-binding subunit XdhB [Bacilli bacterium]|nr:xanthine dehydrogenase FAD-binding subunit XdhB [Bacilli bacterium]
MFDIKQVYEPMCLKSALEIYQNNPHLTIIAGGTDVLINLRHGKYEEVELLSLQKIKGLDEIKILEDGTIEIGALTTFTKIFRNDIINKHVPILAEAAVSMGGPQIRNIATIGGNICNGAVSADSAPALFTLNALLYLETANASRTIPITEFYAGPGRVKLQPGEILTKILITKDNYENFKGKYFKFSNRKAMDIAMIGVAVLLNTTDNKVNDLRIALGVSAPTPIRCQEAEKTSLGLELTEENMKRISELTILDAKPRDSWRGSKAYREHLIKVLTYRALRELRGNK